VRWRRGPLDNRTRHHGSTHDRSTRHHCRAHHYDGHGHISDNPDSDNAITNATDWTPLVYTDNLIDPFGPSGTVEYKDTDPYLLGLIAEHHGGDTLNRLYADRFFLPLGISAGLVPQDAYPADMAHPYGDLSYYAMSEGFGDIVEAVWWMDHFESRKQAP
jgi:CubicO group peptidase (beta-lactamase class C family)